MSDISSECPGTHWCNSNCLCSPISTQGRNFDTIYHKFNLVSKFDEINQGLPNSLTNLWTVMHLLSCQIPQICSTFLHILPEARHSKYSAFLTDVIPFLDSAEQSNTTVCLIASSLKANGNTSSETHPVSYPKITPGSYPNSKFSGTVTVLRPRICEVLMSCLYRDNLHFIQRPSMTESIMEVTHIRTPHTKIL